MRGVAGFLVAVSILWTHAASCATLDSSLLTAAQEGNAPKIHSLLSRGANPNAANSDGNTLTALMLAARGGHSNAVRLLLEAGAKVQTTGAIAVGVSGVNEGVTALMEAAASGDPAIVELLLDHHADPNAAAVYEETDSAGATRVAGHRPVIMSAASFTVLRLLVEHGANLHTKDDDGNSVLMFAAEHLDPVGIRYLLAKGADAGERNRKGLPALDIARQAGKVENEEALKAAKP